MSQVSENIPEFLFSSVPPDRRFSKTDTSCPTPRKTPNARKERGFMATMNRPGPSVKQVRLTLNLRSRYNRYASR